ncbi:MAG: beta-lactamase family protein [Deltaproteobacteria bacterium]|nr:beta-lactamase family protein [Nannocystaceae bacterium]
MAAQLQRRGVVGAQLVIVNDGAVVLSRNYGEARKAGAKVTDDTAFAIGSITKQFVCAAALALEQEGTLSLDDLVSAYYPGLTRAKEITLDDLGTHRSGYPDYYPLDFLDRRMMTPIEPDALLDRYAKAPLDFDPRTRWSYSNTGFVVLGRVIEKVGGVPLAEQLRRRLFALAAMDDASFDPPNDVPGLAHGHAHFALGDAEPIQREARGWIHAAGGIYASAGDLARWDLALVDGKILRPPGMKKLTTPRKLADGRSTEYGCGIGVRQIGGETVWSHSGAVSGFLAYNTVVPRTRSAVVLLVNTEGSSVGELHQEIVQLLVAPAVNVPVVAGPAADVVARELLAQLQSGKLERDQLGAELSHYYDDARLRGAAERLRALGTPTRVEAGKPRERGGMEVTNITFTFATRNMKAMLYRTPDGIVQEFLLLHD